MKTYDKLIRDKIPEILNEKGIEFGVRIADKNEYIDKLYLKLQEELNEFVLNPSAEEIADMLEVIEAMARLHGIGLDDIKKEKIDKKTKRGGFAKKIVLEWTDEKNENVVIRDGSHVTLDMGDNKPLDKNFKTSGTE